MTASRILFTFFFITVLFSCNKDEVIGIEGPEETEQNGFRPFNPLSSSFINKVYEYTPAPGQYINDFGTDYPTLEDITDSLAAEWAFERLEKHYFVSLGAFGGYLVAGFDHSIANTGGYEFGVLGNAFLSQNGSSDEPGIVYVMKDENNNGLPDDTWYELKGSDTFDTATIRDYQVTYYRPDEDGQNVRWTDNLGNTGEISYFGMFHSQPTYYPVWIDSERYTLSGTCLAAKTMKNPQTGNWENPPFLWGYADNIGEDNIEYLGFNNCNRFKISNAIDSKGNDVLLDYIDFVKIQTGVCATAGWLGEVSTEVFGIIDLSM